MRDGVRLSVTYFKPASTTGDRFPVLFEYLPYRKDDLFYLRDYPLYSYFARRGYVVAKVDVRGTGSSEGEIPDREYSGQEIADGTRVIEFLAAAPWSNGKVGMFGISWSGFNAIQLAMSGPPALKAILAVDASDDLFHDDIHFIDGIFHMDEYHLSIYHDLGLPRSPEYPIDDRYLKERFLKPPWQAVTLEHQQLGEFWKNGSLRPDYSRLKIPAYLIGGLLDGYRDSVPRMLEQAGAPMKGEIGPWNHAWPDNGEPGPNYEWRERAVAWWDRWLKGKGDGLLKEPRFVYFLRDGHAPDARLESTPGEWRACDWPIAGAHRKRFFPAKGNSLQESPAAPGEDRLEYHPESGVEAGYWWGEPTGDMRPTDKDSLIFDSAPLAETLEIVGFPKLRIQTSTPSASAHWVARLEDVRPDGSVSLVTGAAINGLLEKRDAFEWPMHFSTWRFRPGHRIRLAISHGLFPMFWPTPSPVSSRIVLGEGTWFDVPLIPASSGSTPLLPTPRPREQRPDAEELESTEFPHNYRSTINRDTGIVSTEATGSSRFKIGERIYRTVERVRHFVDPKHPASAGFLGESGDVLELGSRRLQLSTVLEVRSDEGHFTLRYKRRIAEDGRPPIEREWTRRFPRVSQ